MMVDNGIVCVEGVVYVKSFGILVLVIDYYLFGDILFNVDVIVNLN